MKVGAVITQNLGIISLRYTSQSKRIENKCCTATIFLALLRVYPIIQKMLHRNISELSGFWVLAHVLST
jgi:hypothetical protein